MGRKSLNILTIIIFLLGSSETLVAQYLQSSTNFSMVEILIPSNEHNHLDPVPKLYLTQIPTHLGMMCRLENRQDAIKEKHFTYRMRLGNLDYVNRLEGKY